VPRRVLAEQVLISLDIRSTHLRKAAKNCRASRAMSMLGIPNGDSASIKALTDAGRRPYGRRLANALGTQRVVGRTALVVSPS